MSGAVRKWISVEILGIPRLGDPELPADIDLSTASFPSLFQASPRAEKEESFSLRGAINEVFGEDIRWLMRRVFFSDVVRLM